ncbi:hypothetical protein BG006_008024 [Podila minutissima]|uniref:Uncharacterized protein n=1 Tax=Podila minutissima TaxID=64525 RepID=A0A9P5VK91_9FUNG|nr:hypothetical protein BG006_008024 [Podila minutissima]
MTDYQSFRLAGSMDEAVTRIEVSLDEQTGQKLVFWDDIEDQFPGIQSVKDGDIAVSFARDSKRKRIEPLCIMYRPGAVLDVFLTVGSPVSTLHSRSGSIYRSPSTTVSSTGHPQPDQRFPSIHVSSPPSHAYSHRHQQSQSTDLLSPAIADISIASQLPLDTSGPGTANVLSHPYTNDPPSPPLPNSAPLVRTTSQLVPKIQSTLQTSAQLFGHFEQSIKHGQLTQAESIKQEIRHHFGDLQAEISKNKELQLQTLELQQTAAEMQQRMLTMQQQALDRLALIQSRVQSLITTTYELHEYPIPRLFIVLPRATDSWDRLNPFTHKFRLYFLCECGDHTRTPGSKISHHIHLAKHEGYDVDRPTEFFEKYGSYVLIMMEMIRYGIVTAGVVVPALANSRLLDGFDGISDGVNLFTKDSFGPLVQESIEYVQRHRVPDYNQAPFRNETTTSTDADLAGQVALEGADLRQLASFLRNKDEAKVLGNLYRIVTQEGHVKWVCLDHYRENYREESVQLFKETVAVNGGSFDAATGKVQVRLRSSIVARHFYDALEQAKFIQELSLVLDWDTALEDFKMLRDTMVKSNVVSLKLDCCNATGPSRDILLSRTKRYDPIVQMMANTKLQSFSLLRCDGFWSRLTKLAPSSSGSSSPSSPSSPSPPGTGSGGAPSLSFPLKALSIQGAMDHWKHDQHRLEEILRQSPKLTELKLQVADTDGAFEVIKASTHGFRHLRLLNLSVIQSSQQEQVDVVFDNSGEISNVVISTNKRPYTQLAYSGKVSKLVMYHEFAMRQEGAQLHKVLEKNTGLKEIGVRCHVSGFVGLFELVRKAVVGHAEFERLEIQDLAGWNKIYSTDLKDPMVTRLELTSTDSTGREDILGAFGWAIKSIPSGIQFTASLAAALERGMHVQASVLQRLHLDITKLDRASLDHFVSVIDRCDQLEKLDVLVQWHNSDLNSRPLAKFIARVSTRISHLSLRAYGLFSLFFDLASFMVPRYDGPTFVPGCAMPQLQELLVVPAADTQTKIKHCQLNGPQIRWLVIPLASPSLRRLSLGYLDILKDDWTATLQAICFESLQHLELRGMNLSDAQARLLASLVPPRAVLKTLTIEDSLVSKACLASVEEAMHETIPSCQVIVCEKAKA